MQRDISLVLGIAGFTMAFVSPGWGDVPAPPVNQDIGMPDVRISNLEEADCRVCHSSGVPDRHHMLYGQFVGEESVAPFPDADGNGVPDTVYGCLTCHDQDFTVVRDCTVCHNADSPHHSTAAALARDCVACHGDLVDNFDDGHYVPTYDPSLVTPTRTNGLGLPANSRGKLAGACDYCHDDDGLAEPVIQTSRSLHHGTGLLSSSDSCDWCHNFQVGLPGQTRRCEQCHGPDSLHNIQADSPNPANVGTIVVGGEDAGYGHVGREAGPGDSDCWGCHGFSVASAPRAGPIIPSIAGSDVKFTRAGTDTPMVVGGSGFTNTAADLLFESAVLLTTTDGAEVTLTPDSLSHDRLSVTIPGTMSPGNYHIQAVKAQFTSNPTVVTVVPQVLISDATADGATVIINGSGFGGFAAGSGTSVKATDTNLEGAIVSWTDTSIVAEFDASPADVTVTSVWGTGTSSVAGGGSLPIFRRGDSNGDGIVDLSDAVHTLVFLFLDRRALKCPDASDTNDSSAVDVSDAVLGLNWLFLGDIDVPAPGPSVCGSDPTEDSLPACDYSPNGC